MKHRIEMCMEEFADLHVNKNRMRERTRERGVHEFVQKIMIVRKARNRVRSRKKRAIKMNEMANVRTAHTFPLIILMAAAAGTPSGPLLSPFSPGSRTHTRPVGAANNVCYKFRNRLNKNIKIQLVCV